MRPTAAVLLLAVLAACSGAPRVTTEQDWDTDFAQYQTYAWSRGAAPGDPSIDGRIRGAVDFELMFKGLTRVELAGSPDLHISSYASAEEALVIDLVDARSARLVWRGLAAKAVGPQHSDAALRKAVREIFRHYPHAG
jgi:hypothetical protein